MARLRRRKDRGNYLLDYKDPADGKRYQINVGESKEIAEIWLAKCQEKVGLVMLGHLERVGKLTQDDIDGNKKKQQGQKVRMSKFRDLYDERVTLEFNLSAKTRELARNAINSFIIFVGDKYLTNITQDDVRVWRKRLRAERALTTESMYGRTLRAAFSRAVKWELVAKNPLQDAQFASNRLTSRKEQDMAIGEVRVLLKEIDEQGPKQYGDYIRCLLYTGARRNEILFLKGEDVDLKRKILTVTVTKRKGGPVRLSLPISEALCRVLSDMRIEEGVYLFRTNSNSRGAKKKGKSWSPSHVTHYFKKMIEKATLPEKYSIHSLRHTYVTYLREKGVPIDVVQRLVGHTSPMMTWDTYDHTEALSYRRYAEMVRFEDADEDDV